MYLFRRAVGKGIDLAHGAKMACLSALMINNSTESHDFVGSCVGERTTDLLVKGCT